MLSYGTSATPFKPPQTPLKGPFRPPPPPRPQYTSQVTTNIYCRSYEPLSKRTHGATLIVCIRCPCRVRAPYSLPAVQAPTAPNKNLAHCGMLVNPHQRLLKSSAAVCCGTLRYAAVCCGHWCSERSLWLCSRSAGFAEGLAAGLAGPWQHVWRVNEGLLAAISSEASTHRAKTVHCTCVEREVTRQ